MKAINQLMLDIERYLAFLDIAKRNGRTAISANGRMGWSLNGGSKTK